MTITSTQRWTIICLCILIAIILDYSLLIFLKKLKNQRSHDKANSRNRGKLFKSIHLFSPLIEWFRQNVNFQFASPTEIEGNVSFSVTILFEWLLIILAVIYFCSGFISFNPGTNLPGSEVEIYQYLDRILYNSLVYDNHFPLWNPYIYTGVPLVADPMFTGFSPVVTIPILLLGVRAGFKCAVFLSFLIGAFGMWWLGKELGLTAPSRLWLTCVFAFAGQPAARFFQGQYLFLFSWAWIAWIFASLLMLLRTRRKIHMAMAVISLAMVYFSGNVYYAFFTLFVVIIFCTVYSVEFRPGSYKAVLKPHVIGLFLLTGILAIGLIAIQLLPMAEFWPWVQKSVDLRGSQKFLQVILSFVSKDSYRPDIYSTYPVREDFYAFIGIWPLLMLLSAPLAFTKKNRSILIFSALVFIFTLIWIDMGSMPWADWYLSARIGQFRCPLRIIIYTEISILIVSALGMDSLGKMIREKINQNRNHQTGALSGIAWRGAFIIWIVLLIASGVDVLATNQKIVKDVHQDTTYTAALDWLQNQEDSLFYMRINPNNTEYETIGEHKMRPFHIFYNFFRLNKGIFGLETRMVDAGQKYLIQGKGEETIPEDAQVVYEDDDNRVYKLTNSLPFAFSIPLSSLNYFKYPDAITSRDKITEFKAYSRNTDEMWISATSQGADKLIVLSIWYPGWTVQVDGKPASLYNLGGYLAVDMLPGEHTYTFQYHNFLFIIGLFLSLISLGVTVTWLIADCRPEVNWVRERALSVWVRLYKKGIYDYHSH